MDRRTVELKSGYYEWNVYVDDELYFTFDDLEFDDEQIENATKEFLDDLAKFEIDCMKNEMNDLYNFEHIGRPYDLCLEEYEDLYAQMKILWGRHYFGIDLYRW